ncbi:hypothetical protein FRY74_06500 [Vicingus serpentipes]|uniref:Uncharacterized protein n=1 Tax=Vicingus serpentipes TaxID=1926625 RepID=A0A5C6RRU7_9FLAO|nr:hypothetical protein [Vicingus serpentipes]TXB65081.1 hypothetical protein FRY74_06500 [Vicingus serpentipes]
MSTKLKLFIVIITTLFFSCKKNFDAPSWDVDVLAPLVNTSLSLNDLLQDSLLETNTDGSLQMVYQTDLIDIDVDSLFKIPDTTIVEEFVVPLTSVVNPGSTFYSNDEEKELNISNGIELNYAKIESGFIDLEVFSEVKERIVVTLKILSASLNGDTLFIADTIEAATASVPGYFSTSFDISNYELDLTGINNNSTNTLVTKAIASLHPEAFFVQVNSGDKIIFNYKFRDVVPYYVKGYFGSQDYQFGPETTDFNIFNTIVGGSIDLNDVNVMLDFENGIGVDAQLSLTNFSTQNLSSGNIANLSGSIINSPININRAQETYNFPEVIYSYYQKQINTSNSNIDELIEVLPDKLTYQGNLKINPLGNISGSNDFLFKKYPLRAKLNVEMPLSIVANNLTLVDTVEFTLAQENVKNIIDGNLFVYANNGYPFDADLKLELLDQNNQLYKTISIINNRIEAAAVNSIFRVETPKMSVLNIPLSATDISELTLANKMKLTVAFTTIAQPNYLKIYSDYKIDLKLVGDFAYQINAD